MNENSQSVQIHLGILQNVIQRMASNSSSCKAWCITIVSAVLVIVADKDKPKFALLTIAPIALFLFLDTYYLALERGFVRSYNNFIKKLHESTLSSSDLYSVKPSGCMLCASLRAFMSFSVWPFYAGLMGMVYLMMKYVIS